ncbi:hypothetical protein [Algoriphagus aquimarinus]|uniref:hypothetical protein n=1 Tax=Algoriphagus aquimarinus TaxID=237018 RepID=UPI0030D6FA30|tara:strand:+ start:3905 stop:4516 length:612 start_codon:yes stop_codon:yes gene_type:complete
MNTSLIKKATIIIFLLSICNFTYCQNSTGQSNFNFDESDRKISWVKVFEPPFETDLQKIKDYYTQNQILEITTEESSFFIGKFIPRPIDIQKYGYKRGMTPMVLLDVEQVFNVRLEFKDGRYRVSLSQMGYIDNGVLSDLTSRAILGNTATTAKGNIESYNGDFSFNNKNEVRKNIDKILEILEKFYSDVLEVKEIKKDSSDW